jgi:plastocyanin
MIEREDVEDDPSKVETRVLEPGESVELDLEAGVYKLECNVEGHDDMGMEMLLEVSPDAPLAAEAAAPAAGTPVTAEGGSFDSGTMAEGASFETTFDSPGEYRYICALHPGMKGMVTVEG